MTIHRSVAVVVEVVVAVVVAALIVAELALVLAQPPWKWTFQQDLNQ